MQTDVTLLANNSQHCWMLHVKSVCRPCCMLLRKVWNQSNFSAINSLVQQCWIPFHSSSNVLQTLLGPRMLIVHGLQKMGVDPFHDALHVPTLLGVVTSVCTPLPTDTQQCLELLSLFARSLIHLRIWSSNQPEWYLCCSTLQLVHFVWKYFGADKLKFV